MFLMPLRRPLVRRSFSATTSATPSPLFPLRRPLVVSLRRSFSATTSAASSPLSISLEDRYCAKTYSPLPFVISKAKGCMTWSPEGDPRMDFLSAFSAANQGHAHPRILKALNEQAEKLTLISRAFHCDNLGVYAQFLTETLGYERMLPQNSGVEGWEVAMKLARKWAYTTKRVQPDQAVILFPSGNFGGRTLAAVSASTDPTSYGGYGPLLPGISHCPFGDADAVEAALAANPNIIAYYAEPIQGEAGIVIPPSDYFAKVQASCKRHGALLIADEVQTGLGRTGGLLASFGEGVSSMSSAAASAPPPSKVSPDIVVLGKALGGGVLPVSAVLSSHDIMLTIRPGEHGSTFGGNPLANAVAMAALSVVVEEGLCANANARGVEVRAALHTLVATHPTLFKEVRGIGLMNALEMNPGARDGEGAPISAWEVCVALGEAGTRYGLPMGLLCKPTHEHTIRLTPPLVITPTEVNMAMGVMSDVCERMAKGGDARRGLGQGGGRG